MKIILYGLGSGIDQIKKVLRDEHEIIAYTDSFSCIKEYMGVPFVKPSEIVRMEFDFIIIAIVDRMKAFSIYQWLVKEFNLDDTTIIPYYCYVDMELHKAKLLKQVEPIKGLIIGNSMSQYGFIEEIFPISFLNLSCRSQDIYGSSYILNKIITEQAQKIEQLQYIIFDLYDYNVFNIDLSLTTGYLDYISWGGVYIEHNFNQNSHYKYKLYTELFKDKYLIRENIPVNKVFCELFLEHSISLPANRNDNRFYHIDMQAPLTSRKFVGANVKNHFRATINENIVILDKIVRRLKDYKHDIEIVFTLTPRFITMEEVAIPFMKEWRMEFDDIIKSFQDKYGVRFYNFKECKEISSNCQFFADIDHLNTIGGRSLTSILVKKLKI